jgi:hypothetical protein
MQKSKNIIEQQISQVLTKYEIKCSNGVMFVYSDELNEMEKGLELMRTIPTFRIHEGEINRDYIYGSVLAVPNKSD